MGWRKPQSKEGQTVEDLNRAAAAVVAADAAAKPVERARRKKDPAASKEDDQWSKRIQASIKGTMLEHISQGMLSPPCIYLERVLTLGRESPAYVLLLWGYCAHELAISHGQ